MNKTINNHSQYPDLIDILKKSDETAMQLAIDNILDIETSGRYQIQCTDSKCLY